MNLSFHFTLHTDPRAEVPEFTVSCRTYGGPVKTVTWAVNADLFYEGTSQVILDTSHISVYDNRLRVTGDKTGNYLCIVNNDVGPLLRHEVTSISQLENYEAINGKVTHYKITKYNNGMPITVAGEPTSLEAVISESNSSHVNVTVSWESPADPVTGYVIYYQTKGEPVISDMVSGGETETHSPDGLQRGVTYYVSILALSQHLPSPLVEPVTVIGEVLYWICICQSICTVGVLIQVETSSQFSSDHAHYSLICTVKVEVDQEMTSSPITIEWTTHNLTSFVKIEHLSVCTVAEVTGSCVVNITDTLGDTFYRCMANHSGLNNFSDIFVDKNPGIIIVILDDN